MHTAAESRKLDVGDWAVTAYNTAGSRPWPLSRVQIVAVDRLRPHGLCPCRVMFQVRPLLKYGSPESWYCSGYFEPARPRARRLVLVSTDGQR
jgi:hypothetical protein